jgi:hypothetical protein
MESKGLLPLSCLKTFSRYALLLTGVIILVRYDLIPVGEQQFVHLARSFLDGHLYFTSFPGRWDDTSYYAGHYYWPEGPLPALILLPFVAVFGSAVQQGYFLCAFNLLNLILLYGIALKITMNSGRSRWLSFAYIFGTSYLFIALIPWSWYFAQAVATSFILLALYEFFHERRWWLIGLYTALAIATRVDFVLAGVFFGLSIGFEDEKKSQKMKQLARFFIPVTLSVVLLMAYNFLRFNNIFETGYGLSLLHGKLAANRGYGLWSLVHLPANLYYFFLRGPVGIFIPGTKVLTYPYLRADWWGMSILFTSPILLWVFKAPWKNTVVRLSVLTSLSILVAFLGYCGISLYRYALDFYPFLFVALAYACETELGTPIKIITLISFFLNYYLVSFM